MKKSKSEYRFESVWQKVDDALCAEIIAFWSAESALSSGEDAATRARQAVVVMRDGDGAIAAVSTAVVRRLPRLQQPVYYYRTYCAERHRGRRTLPDMLGRSQEALQDYNTGLDTPDAIGVIVELENSILAGRYTEAHNTELGYTFIGKSPRGYNLFVRYFPGFRLQAPQSGA